jgi:ABC-type sugar transport system ATPase subunit
MRDAEFRSRARKMNELSHNGLMEVRRLSKRFGSTQALRDVSLSIRPGKVHAVLGENGAGKSTLIAILSGALQPDSGEILLQGQPVHWSSPIAATRQGISVVHQELALCPNLTAVENIGLHEVSVRAGWKTVPRTAMRRQGGELLQTLGFDPHDLDLPVRRLSLGQQQLVEIAKALATNVRVLILDEPNSALTKSESARLFRIIRELRANGVAIVYVSHRLEEVMDLADESTILRDGRLVEHGPQVEYTISRLIERMVGREINHLFHREPRSPPGKEAVFEVANLDDGRFLRGVAFEIRAGEILGLAGLPGSGKDEFIDCLTGERPCTGVFRLKGRTLRPLAAKELLRQGIALVPADRRLAGMLPSMNVQDNICAGQIRQLSRYAVLQRKKMETLAETFVRLFRIKLGNVSQSITTLSGGNQQKVILARNLATKPDLLVLHEPTRGIDVGAKSEIYNILNELAGQGTTILIVSSELSELIGQCDRLLTMWNGRISGTFSKEEFEEQRILAAAMGQIDSKTL